MALKQRIEEILTRCLNHKHEYIDHITTEIIQAIEEEHKEMIEGALVHIDLMEIGVNLCSSTGVPLNINGMKENLKELKSKLKSGG